MSLITIAGQILLHLLAKHFYNSRPCRYYIKNFQLPFFFIAALCWFKIPPRFFFRTLRYHRIGTACNEHAASCSVFCSSLSLIAPHVILSVKLPQYPVRRRRRIGRDMMVLLHFLDSVLSRCRIDWRLFFDCIISNTSKMTTFKFFVHAWCK